MVSRESQSNSNSPSLPASPPQAGERSRSTAPLSRPLPRKRGRGAEQSAAWPNLNPVPDKTELR